MRFGSDGFEDFAGLGESLANFLYSFLWAVTAVIVVLVDYAVWVEREQTRGNTAFWSPGSYDSLAWPPTCMACSALRGARAFKASTNTFVRVCGFGTCRERFCFIQMPRKPCETVMIVFFASRGVAVTGMSSFPIPPPSHLKHIQGLFGT